MEYEGFGGGEGGFTCGGKVGVGKDYGEEGVG